MKKIIIVALCLAAVWGCSDDKVTTPDIVDKDTVEKTFVTLEAIINTVGYNDILDTLGDASKLDKLCNMGDKNDIQLYPTIANDFRSIQIYTDGREEPVELIVSLETAKVSSELRDIVLDRYGFFREHEEFAIIEHYRDTIYAKGWAVIGLPKKGYPPGTYIVRVKRTGVSDRCSAFIHLGGN